MEKYTVKVELESPIIYIDVKANDHRMAWNETIKILKNSNIDFGEFVEITADNETIGYSLKPVKVKVVRPNS